MWNICRTCMSEERTLISIFDQAKSPPINAMITAITSLELSPNDTLPSQICVTCLETVEITYYFKEQAVRCNNVLQQQAQTSKLHVLQPVNDGEDETEKKEVYFYNDQKRYVTIDNSDVELPIENVTFNDDEPQSKCSEPDLMAISNDTFDPLSERDVKSFHLEMALKSESRDHDLSEASSSNDSKDDHSHFEEKYFKLEEIDIEEHGVLSEGNSERMRSHSEDDLSLTALLASAESYPKNQDIQQYLNEKHEETRNASNGLSKPGTAKPLTSDITYKCTYCNRVFNKKASYKQHVYTHTRPHTCEVCEKPFSCANYLKRHMTLHTGEKDFECKHCNMRFTRGDHLNRHNRLHTGEGALKRHKCEECEKTFPSPSHLRRHMLSHTQERPFKCEQCSAGFVDNSALKLHIRIHTGEGTPKRYICEVCGVACYKPGRLKKHMMKHTGELSFKCQQCNAEFKRIDKLKNHICLHTRDSNPCTCEVCGKTIAYSKNVARHMRSHRLERPFKCQHCNADFTQKIDLKRHIRLHSGEAPPKPHKCEVCEKSFERPGILMKHMSSHTPERR